MTLADKRRLSTTEIESIIHGDIENAPFLIILLLNMLSLDLRFVFQFSLILYAILGLIGSASVRHRCKSDWYYLSEDSSCVLFATTSVGDLSWMNSSDACQANSADLLNLANTTTIQSMTRTLNDNAKYFQLIQRGTWIGKAKWLDNDLCDRTSTTEDDLQLNCIILTIHSDNQTLCLKKVSCSETHPFICQTRAMTDDEWENTAMERVAWYECLIPVWCIIDAVKENADSKKQAAADATAKAIAAAELQGYLNQFAADAPNPAVLYENQQALISGSNHPAALADSGKTNWLLIIGSGFVSLLLLCLCAIGCICIFKKMKQSHSADRAGSIDSSYST